MIRRAVVLAALLVAYVVAGLRPAVGDVLRRRTFDPFLPAARALELRIEDGRYADALPLAIDLDAAYPREPQIAMWLARIHHGLGDPRREAAAWDRYVGLGTAPADACPAWPDAYRAAGEAGDALRTYERCTALAPDDAERFIDLAEAYWTAGRLRDACRTFERAVQLDPSNPRAASRFHDLQDGLP